MEFTNQYNLGAILSMINYTKLQRGLKSKYSRIVLFEYVHSPSDSDVFSTERLPGTQVAINGILWGEFMNKLRDVIDVPNSYLYTRRKCDGDTPTNFRQLVMRVEYPKPVVAAEYVTWDDMPGLIYNGN